MRGAQTAADDQLATARNISVGFIVDRLPAGAFLLLLSGAHTVGSS